MLLQLSSEEETAAVLRFEYRARASPIAGQGERVPENFLPLVPLVQKEKGRGLPNKNLKKVRLINNL